MKGVVQGHVFLSHVPLGARSVGLPSVKMREWKGLVLRAGDSGLLGSVLRSGMGEGTSG